MFLRASAYELDLLSFDLFEQFPRLGLTIFRHSVGMHLHYTSAIHLRLILFEEVAVTFEFRRYVGEYMDRSQIATAAEDQFPEFGGIGGQYHILQADTL